MVGEILNGPIDDSVRLATHLESLGRLHEKHGVPRRQIDAMSTSFIRAIRPVLQARTMWNSESKETWRRLLKVLCYHMKKGYQDQSCPTPEPSPIKQKRRPSPEVARAMVDAPKRE